MAWGVDDAARQRMLELAELTPDDWSRTVAKPSEPFWTPLQVPDYYPEEAMRHEPEPARQPLWHTVVACAVGFPLGYAVAFGLACLGLYELPWQWVAVGAILPGLVIGFLIAAHVEDELRFR